MYTVLSSLGKNFILLGILSLSVVNYFYGIFGWKELLSIQALSGLAYIFLSCYEFLNAQYKSNLPVQRYSYLTNRFITFKILKITIYIGFGIALYLTGSRVKYFYPICLMVGLTEAAVLFLKYKKQICFVSIYANYLLFSQEKLSKIFANEILLVEFRHNIFYFVKKNRKTSVIKLEHITNKDLFLKSMDEWLKRNKVNVGGESSEKIKAILSN
ncbi:MAG: hypothetical protein IPM51_06565 [Sphingobacteriaceae bacterium]|nr:hypothetical protein [Sphingobacteriaceae bacterium]